MIVLEDYGIAFLPALPEEEEEPLPPAVDIRRRVGDLPEPEPEPTPAEDEAEAIGFEIGAFYEKHKWYILGGSALLLLVALRRRKR